MIGKIHYTKPSITSLEIKYATDAAAHGWGEDCYSYIDRFEALFREHLGVKYCIATSSCTGALHMGMAGLGIGAGDEVILADSNWIATVAPIVYLGAKPVFVDISPESWCIDPDQAERAISPSTKAIIATHLYGNLCDMDRLLDIGKRYGVPVIEDAAEAIGSKYLDKPAGSLGQFGAFSFHGTKTITTGEGGMFVTNDSALFERVLTLSNHGRSRKERKQFWPEEVGFKYKLSNVQAAIGCGQMERIDELIKRKREIFFQYHDRLSPIVGVTMNPEPNGSTNGFWMPTVVFAQELGAVKEDIIQIFAKQNIDARTFFWPLSGLSMFDSVEANVVARSVANRAINLPSYHELCLPDIVRVVNLIKEITKC